MLDDFDRISANSTNRTNKAKKRPLTPEEKAERIKKKVKPLYFSKIRYPPVQRDYKHLVNKERESAFRAIPSSVYSEVERKLCLPHKPLCIIDAGDVHGQLRVKNSYRG